MTFKNPYWPNCTTFSFYQLHNVVFIDFTPLTVVFPSQNNMTYELYIFSLVVTNGTYYIRQF